MCIDLPTLGWEDLAHKAIHLSSCREVVAQDIHNWVSHILPHPRVLANLSIRNLVTYVWILTIDNWLISIVWLIARLPLRFQLLYQQTNMEDLSKAERYIYLWAPHPSLRFPTSKSIFIEWWKTAWLIQSYCFQRPKWSQRSRFCITQEWQMCCHSSDISATHMSNIETSEKYSSDSKFSDDNKETFSSQNCYTMNPVMVYKNINTTNSTFLEFDRNLPIWWTPNPWSQHHTSLKRIHQLHTQIATPDQ